MVMNFFTELAPAKKIKKIKLNKIIVFSPKFGYCYQATPEEQPYKKAVFPLFPPYLPCIFPITSQYLPCVSPCISLYFPFISLVFPSISPAFAPTRPSGPGRSQSRHVCVYVCMCVIILVIVDNGQSIMFLVFHHKIEWVGMILYLKGHQNCMTGSKVTTIVTTFFVHD